MPSRRYSKNKRTLRKSSRRRRRLSSSPRSPKRRRTRSKGKRSVQMLRGCPYAATRAKRRSSCPYRRSCPYGRRRSFSASPRAFRGGKRRCSRGKIVRRSYSYKRNGKTVHVKSKCVKDMGEKGKTPKSRRVLPKPMKGALGKYGYGNVKETSTTSRRRSLAKAIKGKGYLETMRHLNLVRNYNKNNPKVHKRMTADINWMKKNYGKK